MKELTNLIMVEKFRPTSFDDLIFNEKNKLLEYLKSPKTIPSFIFYSSKPGTGKTTTAKIIIDYLKCDSLSINASDERGVDSIREKVGLFARGLSFDKDIKKCVFLDEADSYTKIAAESLKNIIETYSDNVFFIFSCNNISGIIEPIRSRCVSFNFNKPDKKEILNRLLNITKEEGVELSEDELGKIINLFYPDIRSMIISIQDKKLGGGIDNKIKIFNEALIKLKAKDVEYFKTKIYSQELDSIKFNNYMFDYFFNNYKLLGIDKTTKILLLLADTEKTQTIGGNYDIVFVANLLEIMRII